MIRVWW